MIAKQIKGKDFYGLLAYHEKKVKEDNGYKIDSNIVYAKTVDMTKEFNIVRQLRPGLQKAVYHVSLNLPHGENLSDKEFASLGWDYLKGMGFDENQYIIYRHTDQEHQHIHIIANRVKFSGEVVSDRKDYQRSELLVRKLEKKYGLSQITDNKLKNKSALTQNEIEKALRTGNAPIKYLLQQKINEAITKAIDVSQFVEYLKLTGISPKFNVSNTTGRVTGISFKYLDIIYKGSTLGRKYSWNTLIKHIDYEQIRDSSIILENNLPKRGNKGTHFENSGTTAISPRASGRLEGRAGKVDEKSKYHLAKNQTDGMIRDNVEATDWNAFKLELLDDGKRKSKKRKRKGRRL